MMPGGSTSPTSGTVAGQAGDDDVEECDNAVDDSS